MYNVGENLVVDGDRYKILGKIVYKNLADGYTWDEYRLTALDASAERWLSIDYHYSEYALYKAASGGVPVGYHHVDSGTQEVVAKYGDVDVEVGEQALFDEYEDSTEEKIYSVERWGDEVEISRGYYLDANEFGREGEHVHSGKNSKFAGYMTVLLVAIFAILPMLQNLSFSKKIGKYLKNTSKYEYATSITGSDKQKATVYKAGWAKDVSEVAYDIIDGVEGNTDSIQQNNEDDDNSIAILTDKEYCLIYQAEDGTIYAQVSSRKYAYHNDTEPYRVFPEGMDFGYLYGTVKAMTYKDILSAGQKNHKSNPGETGQRASVCPVSA